VKKTDASSSKKYVALFYNLDTKRYKRVSFGAKGYKDYTLIKNERLAKHHRTSYRRRHAKDNLTNPTSPGALSMYILWGPHKTVTQNVAYYRRKFKLKK